MSHVFHDRLPGFDERNLLHDGCPECVERAMDPLNALLRFDEESLEVAWRDMRQRRREPLPWDLSVSYSRVLTTLDRVAVLMGRTGGER